MMFQNRSDKISFFLAIVLHVVVFFTLFMKLNTAQQSVTQNQNNVNIVKAFSVNQSAVEQELANIAAAKAQEKKAQQPQQVPVQQTQESTVKQQVPPPPPQKQEHEQMLAKQQAQQKELEKTLKQQMLAEQTKEAKSLKQKLQAQSKALAAAQQAQEKKTLQSVLQKELKQEGKQLQQKKQQLQAQQAATQEQADAADAAVEEAKAASSSSASKGNPTKAANNAQMQGEIDKYKAMIVQAISQEWVVPDGIDKDSICKLLVNLGPGGVVLGVQVSQPSNNPLLDRSAQNAVWKASPLPVPKDSSLFDDFRTIQLTVRPEGMASE